MLGYALMQNAAFWCVCPAYTTTTTTARNYAKSLQRPDKPSRHSHPVPKYRTTNDTNPYGPDAALHSRGRFLFLNFLIWGLLHLQKCTLAVQTRAHEEPYQPSKPNPSLVPQLTVRWVGEPD